MKTGEVPICERGKARASSELNEELRELRPSLVAWGARWGLGPDDAEDLAQEVLLKVLCRRAQFRRHARLSSWVYRIARNESITRARRSTLRAKAESNFNATCPTQLAAGGDPVLRALDARRKISALIRRGLLSKDELELFQMTVARRVDLRAGRDSHGLEARIGSLSALEDSGQSPDAGGMTEARLPRLTPTVSTVRACTSAGGDEGACSTTQPRGRQVVASLAPGKHCRNTTNIESRQTYQDRG